MDMFKFRFKFNSAVIDEFRANNGKVGGQLDGKPLALVTMTGAKSGRELTSLLMYSKDGDDIIVIASKGGEPDHPNWYHNLVANPTVTVEIDTAAYEATAHLTDGAERQRLYDAQASEQPQFAQYAKNASTFGRVIPVFRLVRNTGRVAGGGSDRGVVELAASR